MRCRLVAFLSVLIASLAERPSLQRKLVVDAGFDGSGSLTIIEHGGKRNLAAQRKRTCPEEAALRTVLLDLGLKDSELTDIRNVEGVKWYPRYKCKVMEISFRGRKDLNGTLSQSFKELKDLQKLDLSDTKISGDLAVLANCTKMVHLYLRNTLVTGDLAALAEARIITFLDLSNSKVTGDLGALKGVELRWVRLSNTRITGDVAVLSTRPQFREVDLSDTDVTGALRVNSALKNLEILKLTGTRTKIDFMGRRRDSKCPFPEMATLEVSGSAVDASVSEFLAPLLYCHHLNRIGAAGCGLTGELPKDRKSVV